VDVMWLNGFGFPRYKGGLMFWAEEIGARAIYQQVKAWHEKMGGHWQPAALLKRLGEKNGSFLGVTSL
jgi:3-hydroxyacyl-CoA dehydrogenase